MSDLFDLPSSDKAKAAKPQKPKEDTRPLANRIASCDGLISGIQQDCGRARESIAEVMKRLKKAASE